MQPAGWFVDPNDPYQLRYWDGGGWTTYTQPRAPGGPIPSAPMTYPSYVQPGMPPAVAAKNPAVSLLVSFFLPGVGSMINGDTGTGIAILVIWIVSIPLMFVVVGFFTGLAAFIWGLIDAYQGARRWNLRHGIIS